MVADLHCHTKMSDGCVGIDELIFIAKKRGIKTISVTDHDTFAGSVRAQILGRRYGVEVISGAEISAFDYKRDRNVHLLCYMCDNTDRLEGLFKRIGEARKQSAAKTLQKLMKIYPISPEMVSKRAQGSTNIFRQHLMHSLVDLGYATSIYGDLFNRLFNPKDGLAFSKTEYPDVYEVIKQIHSAGGIAVLAHPAKYDSYDLLGELVDYELDGVEVWYPGSKEQDEEYIKLFAKQYGLIMTGGSNIHGMYSEGMQPLGSFTTPGEQIEKMIKLKDKNKKGIA